MRCISHSAIFGLVVFAIFCWIIWGEGCLLGSVLSPDGVSYLRMAGSAAAGHPFNPNGVAGFDGWFALWPVGYPWCLAALMKLTGLDAFMAARLFATLVVAAILWLFHRHARPAFPVLALAMLNLSFTGIFRCSYSEQPYMLVLIALCFALSSCSSRWKMFLACSGLCIAAFSVRYVGVFSVAWATASVFIVDRIRRRSDGFWKVLPAVVPVGVFVAGYLLLNHAMCGAFTGGHPAGTSESFLALLKRLGVALVNETQAFAFLVVWGAAFLYAVGKGGRAPAKADEKTPDGLVFAVFGLLCNVTVVALRFLMPFDAIGFRLLCPGTVLILVGLVLMARSRLNADWAAALDAAPIRNVLMLLVVVILPAVNFQSIDREIRRITHSPGDAPREAYSVVRKRVLEKYSYVEPHTRFQFPTSHPGEDYWLNFLRPDILADVPDSPDKGF